MWDRVPHLSLYLFISKYETLEAREFWKIAEEEILILMMILAFGFYTCEFYFERYPISLRQWCPTPQA